MISNLKIFLPLHPNASNLITVNNCQGQTLMDDGLTWRKFIFQCQGVGGIDGDGDVYNPKNIREFQRFVFAQTEGKGVHFMMADGVFD